MATAKTFMEVSVQDVGRAPLGEGEETTSLSLPVFELLAVATGKDGGQTWRNFKKRALKGHEDFTMPNGVTLLEKPMIGRAKLALAVRLTEAPLCLATVLDKAAALHALRSPELRLLETLVARGLAEERALEVVAAAARVADPAEPGDAELLHRVSAVFGATRTLRFARVPRRGSDGGGGGTVLVFSAIDLVMAAKGCQPNTAKSIIRRIFKDYYGTDAGSELHLVAEGASCTFCHRVQFPGERQHETLALDAQGAGELLCLIPGSEVSASLRRRAVDTLLRVEGGDESLIDRIRANRRFQEYLSAHDPSHPLRAVGEHAELQRGETTALELAHKKRMLDLEYETEKRQKKALAECREAEAEKARQEAETARQEAERARQEAEKARQEAERARTEAEGTRARDAEATYAARQAGKLNAMGNALELAKQQGLNISAAAKARANDIVGTTLVCEARCDASGSPPLRLSEVMEQATGDAEFAFAQVAAFGKHALKAVLKADPSFVKSKSTVVYRGRLVEAIQYHEKHLPVLLPCLKDFRRGFEARGRAHCGSLDAYFPRQAAAEIL